MHIYTPYGWVRSFLPAGLMLVLAFAHAQPQLQPQLQPQSNTNLLRVDPADAKIPVESSSYRSAFTGYKPLREEPVAAWKERNDLTARIGGWRAYAREAQQPDVPPAAPASAPVREDAVRKGEKQ